MLLRDLWAMSDEELLAEATALERLADREALSDPASLLRRILPLYRTRPHLQVITRQMSRILSGEIDRLLIMVPPQTGKTLTAVIGGAVWWLANRPTNRVIIGSYGDSLAVDRGSEAKKLIVDQGDRYGLALERGSTKVQDWRLTTGGGVLSVGVGAGVTGKNGDLAIVDDPHKSRAEADSLRFRDRVWKWFSADVLSRLSPGAPVVLVMTPWHPDDMAARVIGLEGSTAEGGRWEVVRMPAFCDRPDSDPLGRKLGEPLPHPKIRIGDKARAAAHWNDKRRTSTVQDWAALYMCDPKPAEGALVSRALLQSRRCFVEGGPSSPCDRKPVRAAVAVDPSGGGRDTAGIVGGYLGSDRRLYLIRDASGVMGSDEWSRAACEMAMDIDADLIIFEKNFGGDMAGRVIRTAWDALRNEERDRVRASILAEDPLVSAVELERRVDRSELRYGGLCPRIKAVVARKNKRLRADPIAQQWREDRVRLGAYLPELEDEWATWQENSSESPGRIDASTYLGYALLPMPRSGLGGSAAPGGMSLPTTGTSPLSRDSGGGSGLGPLGR